MIIGTPYDSIAFERMSRSDGIAYVSTAQLAVDCLTGSGRMPEEGEAVVAWMRSNTARWQVDRLSAPGKALR